MEGAANSGTQADHLASFERQTGRKPRVKRAEVVEPEVVDPDYPEVLGYVWRWFQELAGRRTGGAVGPNPLTHQEIEAWARLTGRTLNGMELRLVLRLDDTMMAHFREGAK